VKAYTLLTGATGFNGSHADEWLLQDRSWSLIEIAHGEKEYRNTPDLERQSIFPDPGALL